MKASATLLTLSLIAAGCTDATNAPTGLTPPSSVSTARPGNVPPPPADVAVVVCTEGGCAVFDGTYMTNAETVPDDDPGAAITISAANDGTCLFPGHASLKINRPLEASQSLFEEGTTSANAQIKCHQQIATGNGTVEIGGVVLNFDQVDFFNNQPDCAFSCGNFVIRDDEGNQIGGGFIVESEEFEDAYCFIGEDGNPYCYGGSEG